MRTPGPSTDYRPATPSNPRSRLIPAAATIFALALLSRGLGWLRTSGTHEDMAAQAFAGEGQVVEPNAGASVAAGAAAGHTPRLVVLGSSIAAGYGAEGDLGWVSMLTERLNPEIEVVNMGMPGDDTLSLARRFERSLGDLDPPVGPGDAVAIALSLSNEGLAGTRAKDEMIGLCDVYLANLLHLGMAIERLGATPIVTGVYPNDGFSSEHHAALQRVNAVLLKWGADAAAGAPTRTPYAYTVNFLPAVDDGSGHWKKGERADDIHPNTAGHRAMADAVDIPALRNVILAPASPPPGARSAPHRLLAVGDSLTAGFHNGGYAVTPWAPKLSHALGLRVDYSAGSGKTAGDMVRRAEYDFNVDVVGECWAGIGRLLGGAVNYTHVIIMAGTNDIGTGQTADDTFAQLKRLHGFCHAAGIRTIAVSVPPSAFIDNIPAWAPLNAKLEAWAKAEPLTDFVKFPFEFSAESGLWEGDGLHMSSAGYARFAEGLAAAMQPLLS
eukprot:m.86434 g.86434  ORF g.86434 m.86434 type:complete len:498 (-) comp11462_c0_seq1:108-1601(-)